MELTEFLLARIGEDEARVTLVESAPPKWTMTVYPHDGERIAVEVPALTPARVLAECDAKRRIVEWESDPDIVTGPPEERHVLRLLALPYADHPDYNPDWKV